MTVVTLPMAEPETQQELLAQTLAGIQTVLSEQGARLIGGHTLEGRSPTPAPMSLGLQVSLTVNGRSTDPLPKGGVQVGDALLLSRPLGTGVLFAAAMAAAGSPADLDTALTVMSRSQHGLVAQLQTHRSGIHACTDITGFGLLGHLGEMLQESEPLQVTLCTEVIPAYNGALTLLEQGHASTLAPSNREAWSLLDGPVRLDRRASGAELELLVDPQTCGPLLLACNEATAAMLTVQGPWTRIGTAEPAHG
jgi:selenide,water dikinase